MTGSRCRGKRPLALGLALLLAACANGASTISSLDNSPDKLAGGEKSPGALMRVGDAASDGGDPSSAIGLYRRAHELAPQDPKPLVKLGAALAAMQSYTEAAQAYRQALDLAPKDLDAQRGLGTVLLTLDKPELALTQLSAALAQKEDARLYNLLGVAYDLTARHDLAQRNYAAGLKLQPDGLSLKNNYGLSQALGGDFLGAIATLSGAVASPSAGPRNRQNLALVYGLAGDTDKAAAIARTDLDDASVKNNLAYYALLRGMDDRARAAAIIGARIPAGQKIAEPQAAEAPAAGPITLTESLAKPPVETKPLVALAPAALPETAAPSPARPAATRAAPPKAAASRAASAAPPPPAPAEAPIEAPMPKEAVPVASTETPAEPVAALAPAPVAALAEPSPPAALPTPAPEAALSTPPETATAQAEPAAKAAGVAPAPVVAAASAAAPSEAAETTPRIAAAEAPAAEPSPAAMPIAAPASPAPATRPSGKGFLVQLGAFRERDRAQNLCGALAAKGYDVAVIAEHGETKDWFLCRTTGAVSHDEAGRLAARLHAEEKAPALLVPVSAAR